MRILRFLGMGLCLGTLAAHSAHGIACPTGGSKVKVVVNNPAASSGQQVTISGEVIAGEHTCTGAATSYVQVVNLYTTGDNEFIVPASGGLNSGMWKHHVAWVGAEQHQQKPVLFTSTAADYTRVPWTFHPTVVNVNLTGDTGGTCGSSCTFRQALNKANGLIPFAPAILIKFSLPVPTTLTMTNSADLVIGSNTGSPIVTIDATDANGNPWIVGDALAAAQGSQDSFPVTIDLNNVTKLKVDGDNVTIKGLHIKNTVASGNPTKKLIESARDDVRLEALRLDGGATGTCSPNCGSSANHLIALSGNGSEIVNVEGRAGFANGAELIVGSHYLRDSWLHHNFGHSVAANVVEIERNTLELSGRRLSDGIEVYNQSAGIVSSGSADFGTHRNLVRNNGGDGIQVNATGLGTELTDDYICGNGAQGATVTVNFNSVSMGTGLAAAYNGSGGVRFTGASTGGASATFDNDSAFTSNSQCGFKNDSTVTVNARNNQWRGVTTGLCSASSDRCTGGGTIVCDPAQDAINVDPGIDATQPTFPSNVILKGQTLRVQGSGFNAVDGNPLSTQAPPNDCAIGTTDVSSYNCCRKTSNANVCQSGTSPPEPLSGKGNCVALKTSIATWNVLPVTGVTPTTIVGEIPNTFACSGGSGEQVRVSKKNGTGNTRSAEQPYCLNTAGL